jgi:SAM-dependent methyltransferase/uncharacterized protein YbaR (Trm112 family)
MPETDDTTPAATRPDWSHLACPDDGTSPLQADSARSQPVCPRCHRGFPVSGGIRQMLPRELLQPSADGGDVSPRLSEIEIRDREVELYEELYTDREYRHELATYVRLLDPQPGDRILDVGAGTGRVVKEYVDRCARVSCADFSSESLRFLLAREDLDASRVEAVLADAGSLPFADASFDRVVSLSMFCCLPSDAIRHRFLAHVRRVLRPHGVFVISTYQYAWIKRLWAAFGRTEAALPSGVQSGGIAYRNETEQGFRAELSKHFVVRELRGVCHRVPLISRLWWRLSCTLDGVLGRLDAARPIFATEMVARCTLRDPP